MHVDETLLLAGLLLLGANLGDDVLGALLGLRVDLEVAAHFGHLPARRVNLMTGR